jgi:regulator of RNase E activity RraA
LTAAYRWNIDSFSIPIRIGGVLIEPGDFILGDIDGILVIPKNLATEVVERTLVVTGKEDIVRARLQEGGDIRELFEQYKVF